MPARKPGRATAARPSTPATIPDLAPELAAALTESAGGRWTTQALAADGSHLLTDEDTGTVLTVRPDASGRASVAALPPAIPPGFPRRELPSFGNVHISLADRPEACARSIAAAVLPVYRNASRQLAAAVAKWREASSAVERTASDLAAIPGMTRSRAAAPGAPVVLTYRPPNGPVVDLTVTTEGGVPTVGMSARHLTGAQARRALDALGRATAA